MLASRVLNRVLSAGGLELMPKWRVPRAPQTAYLRRLLDERHVDCVLDVGANRGQYRDYLRAEVGFTGWVVSFEPHPDCYATCQAASASDDRWEVHPVALGAEHGRLDFHLMKDSQFSSFLEPDSAATQRFEASNRVERTVAVDVARLDDVLPELLARLGLERPMLKLDTQGFEPEVLRGAAAVSRRFVALQTEISNVPIYRGIRGMEASLHELSHAGWQLGCLFPTNPDQFPVCIDFDAYFLPAG